MVLVPLTDIKKIDTELYLSVRTTGVKLENNYTS